jgi:hypothetical protein
MTRAREERLRLLLARLLWDADEARYAAWRLPIEAFTDSAERSLFGVLSACARRGSRRIDACLAGTRAAGCSVLDLLYELAAVPFDTLDEEPPIEAAVADLLRPPLPSGLSAEELLDVVAPDWSGGQQRPRATTKPHSQPLRGSRPSTEPVRPLELVV